MSVSAINSRHFCSNHRATPSAKPAPASAPAAASSAPVASTDSFEGAADASFQSSPPIAAPVEKKESFFEKINKVIDTLAKVVSVITTIANFFKKDPQPAQLPPGQATPEGAPQMPEDMLDPAMTGPEAEGDLGLGGELGPGDVDSGMDAGGGELPELEADAGLEAGAAHGCGCKCCPPSSELDKQQEARKAKPSKDQLKIKGAAGKKEAKKAKANKKAKTPKLDQPGKVSSKPAKRSKAA